MRDRTHCPSSWVGSLSLKIQRGRPADRDGDATSPIASPGGATLTPPLNASRPSRASARLMSELEGGDAWRARHLPVR